MRDDLTPAFLAAMAASSREPIQYMQIDLPDRTLYISDQDRDLFGQAYEGKVENWGRITTAGSETSDIIAETLQMSVTFWNGGDIPFSYNFLDVDPMDLSVRVYQTFAGLGETDAALVGDFVIQDPIIISENDRLFTIDLVTINMRFTANVGDVLSRTDWPFALDADVNKGLDLIVGDAGTVQTLAAKTPLRATMSGSILKKPTIVNVHEDLDTLNFAADGFIVIDDETMHYNARDSDTFNVDARAQNGTTASEHSDGATVLEYITEHTYLIGQGPLTSISDVMVGGLPADPADYTVDLVSNPACLIFPRQPSYISYSRGARSTNVDFDSTAPDNTAYQPHYAYDNDFRSYGAIVSENNRTLSILQNDLAIDEGEVVRAFLVIEHWSTKTYPNDHLDVSVDGIGLVGYLSRPSPSDITTVGGDVNIDHPHGHLDGGEHGHPFGNPGLVTSNPAHDHPITGTYQDTYYSSLPQDFTLTGNSATYYPTNTGYATQNTIIFTIDWYEYDVPRSVEIRYAKNGTWYGFSVLGSATTTPLAVSLGAGTISAMYIRHVPYNNSTAFRNTSLALERAKTLTVNQKTTAIAANHSSTGTVNNRGTDTSGLKIKDVGDVNDLSTANRALENISTTSASKKVVDFFDLTKDLETISWDFFKDRKIQVQYVGSTNKAEVVVTYAYFEVEYRQRETVLTNDVTCKPVGSLENRPDAVIEYLLGTVAGIPLAKMGSIFVDVDIWDDPDIWIDTNIWRDTGERLPVPGDPAFLDAAERFAFLGYRLDGVISADSTVQESVKNIVRQTRARLIWSAGLVKLAVREEPESWITVKAIGKDQTQLSSLSLAKSPALEIENDINLSYQIDRLSEASDEGQYDASIIVQDLPSIELHGQKKYNSRWLFDLVRDDTMAADLADYYIWRYGEAITRYNFTSYLTQFDLEKEDVIRLTSDFSRTNLLPLRLIENSRSFGSGKLGNINTINLVGESIRHKLWYVALEDTILAVDDISVGLQDDESIMDNSTMIDEISIGITPGLEDDANFSDAIVLRADFASSLNEILGASDYINSSFSLVLSDSINALDSININYEPCFGACGFGGSDPGCTLPFGAPTVLRGGVDSEAGVSDEIVVNAEYNLELTDFLVTTDDLEIYDVLTDPVGFGEELIFNTCFGCKIENATGFGQNNFGK